MSRAVSFKEKKRGGSCPKWKGVKLDWRENDGSIQGNMIGNVQDNGSTCKGKKLTFGKGSSLKRKIIGRVERESSVVLFRTASDSWVPDSGRARLLLRERDNGGSAGYQNDQYTLARG